MTELLDHLREGLAGRYRVLDEIARGGMAIIFRAEEHHPRRQVAIKVLDPTISTHIARDYFVREVQYCANVPHPQCLPILAAVEASGLLYYVMPYIAGALRRVASCGRRDCKVPAILPALFNGRRSARRIPLRKRFALMIFRRARR